MDVVVPSMRGIKTAESLGAPAAEVEKLSRRAMIKKAGYFAPTLLVLGTLDDLAFGEPLQSQPPSPPGWPQGLPSPYSYD